MKIGRIIAAGALLALGFAALPAIADDSAMSRPLQGYSRTISLHDLCGDCTAEKFVQCGNQIEGPTFDDQGNLYVVSIADGNIMKITPDGKCAKFANTGGEPQGLKFHNGKIYGVDRKRGVFTLDLSTGKVEDYMRYFYGQNFSGPNDLIIDERGGIWFTDAWGTSVLNPRGGVYYITPEPEKKITRVFDNMAFPNGISLSPDNSTLFIDDFGTNRVLSVPLAGPGNPNIGFAHVLAYLSGGFGPDSMAVDAHGNIYAAHFLAREIVVLDPFGFIIGPIVLPKEAGLFTSNVAFRQGWLYITEGQKNEVWRVKMNVEGAKLN